MADSKKQNFLHGAVILTAGLAVIKVLGAIYKIPIANILGNEGYGMFLAAYNVYNVFYTASTAGVPVAMARLIAASDANGRPLQIRRFYRTGMITFFTIGLICSLVMFLFPTELAASIDHVGAAQSIWALSPAILMCCMIAIIRGYTQGLSNMIPTAISQILEVLFKLIFGLALVVIFTQMGKSTPLCCAAAISGVTMGSFIALIFLVWYKHKNYPDNTLTAEETDVPDSYADILKKLLLVVIPISVASSVQSVINLIDTKQIMNLLQTSAGFTYEAASKMFGVYGEAQTLYNLPGTIISAISVSIVPTIAANFALNNLKGAKETSETGLRITAVMALPMAFGLAVLSDPIMNVLYWGKAEGGAPILSVLGFAAFFLCMVVVMTGILQAGGKERLPLLAAIIGGVVKICVNTVMLANPAININGAAFSTLCCYIVMATLDFLFLKTCLGEFPNPVKIISRPLMSTIVMAAAAFSVYSFSGALFGGELGRLLMAVCLALAIGAAVVVYLVMVIVTKSITVADMDMIPKGEKIAKLLHMK